MSKIFQFWFTKSAIKCSPSLPRAAGENVRTLGFLQTKAYKSKTKINFCDFFVDIPKGEASMYLQRKNQHCIFILSVLFCSEIEMRYTLCMHYTLCAGGPSLRAKSGLADDFSQKKVKNAIFCSRICC